MSQPPFGDHWFPLDELTTRLAHLVWVERSIGELYRSWASVEPSDALVNAWWVTGGHHTWHASVLETCLATTPVLGEASVVRAPTDRWEQAIVTLRGFDEADRTAARLSAAMRQLEPWLVRETEVLLDLARPIADGALMRWLLFVEWDHAEDTPVLAELLQATVGNTVSLRDHEALAAIDLTIPAPTPESQD